MTNKSLFASIKSRLPRANAINEAGGRAYQLAPKHALAQIAATGTFGNAYYSNRRNAVAGSPDVDRPNRRQRIPGTSGFVRS